MIRTHPGPRAVAALVAALQQAPTSYADLAEASGLSVQVTTKWVNEWNRMGVVYRSAWDKDTRGWYRVRLFSWGAGRNVPAPAKPAAERNQTYRRRKRFIGMANALAGVSCT